MEQRQPLRIDLTKLAGALKEDLQALGGAEPGAPFARLNEALGEVESGVREVQQTAVERRRRHLEARAEVLAEPIEQRKEELERRVERREKEIAAPLEDGFVVAGRVVDAESGTGLAGVRVRVLERDPLEDDFLGEARTDELGYYRREYGRADFQNLFERTPETYIRVVDEQGQVLYTSDQSFRHRAGKVEILNAAVDGAKMPEAMARSRHHELRVEAEVAAVERRARVLDSRLAVRTGRFVPVKKKPPAAPVPEEKPAAPAPARRRSPSLETTAIQGIGPQLAARLEAGGVTDAATIAAMEPDRLASVLRITEVRAAKIISDARRRLEGKF